MEKITIWLGMLFSLIGSVLLYFVNSFVHTIFPNISSIGLLFVFDLVTVGLVALAVIYFSYAVADEYTSISSILITALTISFLSNLIFYILTFTVIPVYVIGSFPFIALNILWAFVVNAIAVFIANFIN